MSSSRLKFILPILFVTGFFVLMVPLTVRGLSPSEAYNLLENYILTQNGEKYAKKLGADTTRYTQGQIITIMKQETRKQLTDGELSQRGTDLLSAQAAMYAYMMHESSGEHWVKDKRERVLNKIPKPYWTRKKSDQKSNVPIGVFQVSLNWHAQNKNEAYRIAWDTRYNIRKGTEEIVGNFRNHKDCKNLKGDAAWACATGRSWYNRSDMAARFWREAKSYYQKYKSGGGFAAALFVREDIGEPGEEEIAYAGPISTTLQVFIPGIGGEVTLPTYLASIFKYSVSIAGIIATVVIMYGGILYLTAGGNPGAIQNAKSYISSAIFGLILVFGSYTLFQTINPKLVEFQMPVCIEMIKGIKWQLEVIKAVGGTLPSSGLSNVQGGTSTYNDAINAAAKKYDMDPAFIKAIIAAESSFNPRVQSSVGSFGLMQIMPGTAQTLWRGLSYIPGMKTPPETCTKYSKEKYTEDCKNWIINHPNEFIMMGTRYLKGTSEKKWIKGDLALTAAAYNAGPGRVKRAGGIPNIPETINYVKRVKKYHKQFVEESK